MQTTLDQEEVQVRDLFERVDKVQHVADKIQREHPGYAADLVEASQGALSSAPPVRVRIAAVLLSVSDKTIRSWIDEGILTTRTGAHRIVALDAERLHEVIRLVQDLRSHGRTRDLRTALWHRLQDSALLDRADLSESLEQLYAGKLTPALTRDEESSRRG